MALEKLANNAATTLNGGINNSTTTVVVTDASAFPAAGNFRIIVDSEIMLVTAVSSNTFTVTRGTEGLAASHLNAAAVTHVITAASLPKIAGEISALSDTYANRPAAGTTGRLFYPSDGAGCIFRDNGSTWDIWTGGFGPWNPNLADFTTWLNQGVATIDVSHGFQQLARVDGVAGDSIVGRLKSTSGTTWQMRLVFRYNSPPGANSRAGIILRESGSGKLMTYTYSGLISAVTTASIFTWSSPTAFNATVSSDIVGAGYSNPLMMQLRADGTNFYFEYSVDGVYWYEHARLTISGSYLAGYDQIGFGWDLQGANNVHQTYSMSVYHAVFG